MASRPPRMPGFYRDPQGRPYIYSPKLDAQPKNTPGALDAAFARLGIGDRRVTGNFVRAFRQRRAERGRPAQEGAFVFQQPAGRITGNRFNDELNGGITLDELVTGHKPRVDSSAARWEGVKSGALFGGADEIGGFGGAVGNWLGRNGGDWLAPGVSWLTGRGWDPNATFNRGSGDFATDMERERKRETLYRDQAWDTNRSAFLQGYVPGVVVSAAAPALRAAQVPGVARYGAMAATGAGYGALQGGLSAEPGDRMEGALQGAAIGAVAAPVLGRLVDNLATDIPAVWHRLTNFADDFGDDAARVAEDVAPVDPMAGRSRPLVVEQPEAAAPVQPNPVPPVAEPAFNPQVAAAQRERLGAIGDEPMDPALSTAAGAEDTLTFPNGRQADVRTWDTDGINARIAQERPELLPQKAADDVAPTAEGDLSPPPAEPVNPSAAPRVESENAVPHPDSPEGKIFEALGGATRRAEQQTASNSAERSARARAANAAGEGLEGQDKFYAQKAALKGEMKKVIWLACSVGWRMSPAGGSTTPLLPARGFVV